MRTLHDAGIEVILDVVYNHTGEGNHLGPVPSFKGAYCRLANDPRHYYDATGTGNSLNVRHSRRPQLVLDSLRCRVIEMHVDGFRFDLAATLPRQFVHLNGRAIPYRDERGQPVVDDCFLLLLSAPQDPTAWTLPEGLAPVRRLGAPARCSGSVQRSCGDMGFCPLRRAGSTHRCHRTAPPAAPAGRLPSPRRAAG